MTRVLLTGMSGTGKSTLVALLAARGHRAIDTDDGWVDVQPDGTQQWRIDAIRRLLAEQQDGTVFVAGCEGNMVELLPEFDVVILLSAPRDLLLRRLETRTTNEFGKDPQELARILGDLETVEPRLRALADHEVDTSGDPQATVATVLRLAAAAPA